MGLCIPARQIAGVYKEEKENIETSSIGERKKKKKKSKKEK